MSRFSIKTRLFPERDTVFGQKWERIEDTNLKISQTRNALMRMRVYYFRCYCRRTWSLLSLVWPTFQIWGRSG